MITNSKSVLKKKFFQINLKTNQHWKMMPKKKIIKIQNHKKKDLILKDQSIIKIKLY